jgi:hypothetical protein
MNLRFHRDSETEEAHRRHGVTEDEVREVLAAPLEDWQGARVRGFALGQTDAGRYLQIVYVPDREGDSAFVVMAYPLGPVALRALRRRLDST